MTDTKYVHEELERWINERISQELGVCERLVAMAQGAVEEEVALTKDWKIEGIDLIVNPNRLLVAPPEPPPEPTIVPVDHRELNVPQMAGLEAALKFVASAEGLMKPGFTPTVLTTFGLQDLLMRMAASDTDLPEYWQQGPFETNFDEVVRALDADDTGFVTIETVLGYFKDPPAL
jgi:hypothetical protein